jgi:hypothetical protein
VGKLNLPKTHVEILSACVEVEQLLSTEDKEFLQKSSSLSILFMDEKEGPGKPGPSNKVRL